LGNAEAVKVGNTIYYRDTLAGQKLRDALMHEYVHAYYPVNPYLNSWSGLYRFGREFQAEKLAKLDLNAAFDHAAQWGYYAPRLLEYGAVAAAAGGTAYIVHLRRHSRR
jgi:hypothetical protein